MKRPENLAGSKYSNQRVQQTESTPRNGTEKKTQNNAKDKQQDIATCARDG